MKAEKRDLGITTFPNESVIRLRMQRVLVVPYGRKPALFAIRAFSCDRRVSSFSFFCRAISRCGASRSSNRMACLSALRARASRRREVTMIRTAEAYDDR